MKIVSHNVNGLKAYYEKGALENIISQFDPDILCLQETKCSESAVGYWIYDYNYLYIPVSCSNHWKHGYAGVTTLINARCLPKVLCTKSINILDGYGEGRIVILDLPEYYLINVYTLNSGDKDDLRMTWDEKFRQLIHKLQAVKPVVIVGDFNVVPSHLDYWGDYDLAIDTMPGLKEYEIQNFESLISHAELIDSFRYFHPEDRAYSWYSYRGGARAQNKGWRIDFALVSKSMINRVINTAVYSQFEGSDHCPILIELQ